MRSIRAIASALVAASLLTAGTARAAPRPLTTATKAVVASAEGAFKAGDFARASDLYEQAWKAAPDDTTLLYSAGRCAQLAGRLQRAETLLEQYLQLSGQEEKFVVKARAYLADVRAAILEERAAEARKTADRAAQLQLERRYREAAHQYAEAFRLDERGIGWLVLAGEAAAMACDTAAARRHFEVVLTKADSASAQAVQARQRLLVMDKECQLVPEKVPSPAALDRPKPVAPASPQTTQRWQPLALLGAGALAAGVGGALYVVGVGKYDEHVKPYIDAGQTSAAVTDYDKSLRDNYFLPGKVLGGLGLAAAIGGGIWWWRAGTVQVASIAVGRDAVALALEF